MSFAVAIYFTPNNFSQQLGYMNRPRGYEIFPHLHNKVKRKVEYTNETLLIKSGKVRVDFYDGNKNYLKSQILNKGDVILLAQCGHGFQMLENTEMIEIKQGPYFDDNDKTRFESVAKEKITIK
jgi:dTDP-4-dehydrorhamnose 3,5-epimerase-like enzyme